jgi:3-hydroxybutyrate dehydrogenase/3-oxoacyl-[acyl-carrier protein] reductase
MNQQTQVAPIVGGPDALLGKVAVVTGGTRGIGRGIAEAYLAAGASVVLNGRSPEKGERCLQELDAGERAAFVQGDARSQADIERLIDQAVEQFGRVDILVNNAGGSGGFALVEDLSDEAWHEAGDWILNSTFWATRRALKSMAQNKWGRIISISSVEGKSVKKPMASHYATFKHAVIGFMKAVAVEYGPMGITANAICPGAIETDLMKDVGAKAAEAAGISYEEFLGGYAEETLTKNINTVEEVAAVASLLASDYGAGITGTAINVDAGTSPF